GAYVPIDTEYPEDRISYILEDSNCKALLDIKELLIFHTLELNYSKENLLKITTPKDLAYVIYTSGSTGQPKGVMIENSQLVSFLNNIRNNLGMMNIKRVAATTVFSFDISILELLGCLLNGSELYIYSDKVIYDPTILLSKLERDQVDFLQVTPSRLRQLFLVNKNLPKTIKTLLIGGDVLSDVFYDQLKNLKYIERIIHVYGPTETTIWSTSIDINSSENINIGKPIGNTSIYILDSALHLCAKGVVGELCIGGDGLARGYLNRADLTCEKFVPNPFVEGDRIYRTGDLARWLPDGNIEFIGRNDDQVKIRGYRIELGEIEHVLESQAFINQAVVLAKEAETGEAVIVCYIVSDSDLIIEVVRDVLSKSLPSYMLPSHYVQLSEMPLTSNGKVDKKSLLSMEVEGLVSGVEYLAPRSEMEIEMVRIWEDLLEKEKVGLRDDFFVLGGHSLKAIRLINEYHKLFDVRVELKDVFASSTIEGQSQLLASRVKKE